MRFSQGLQDLRDDKILFNINKKKLNNLRYLGGGVVGTSEGDPGPVILRFINPTTLLPGISEFYSLTILSAVMVTILCD